MLRGIAEIADLENVITELLLYSQIRLLRVGGPAVGDPISRGKCGRLSDRHSPPGIVQRLGRDGGEPLGELKCRYQAQTVRSPVAHIAGPRLRAIPKRVGVFRPGVKDAVAAAEDQVLFAQRRPGKADPWS